MNMMRCGRFLLDDMGHHHGKGRHGHFKRHAKFLRHNMKHLAIDSDSDQEMLPPIHHGHAKPMGTGKSFVRKNKFVVLVNVIGYSTAELNIKVANGFITVSGNHESHDDDGNSQARSFENKYKLPDNIQLDTMKSKMVFHDRFLKITGKIKPAAPQPEGVDVPIEIVPADVDGTTV